MEKNKPRKKEAKVFTVKILLCLFIFKLSSFFEIINLVLAPKTAPKETNIISSNRSQITNIYPTFFIKKLIVFLTNYVN